MAYTIAFRGGRAKNILLLIVILPFFTSFLIRTLVLEADPGRQRLCARYASRTLASSSPNYQVLSTPLAVIGGLTYNFLPFMVLPLYVALEKIDPRSD